MTLQNAEKIVLIGEHINLLTKQVDKRAEKFLEMYEMNWNKRMGLLFK